MWQNVAECGRMCYFAVECGRMWQNVAPCGRMWQNVAKCGRMWQNVGECERMHYDKMQMINQTCCFFALHSSFVTNYQESFDQCFLSLA